LGDTVTLLEPPSGELITLERDRLRFVEKVASYVGQEEANRIVEGLDRVLEWSANRDEIEHYAYMGQQSVVQFHLKHNGQVFWAAYPRVLDGAKFSLLPRSSKAVPERIREHLRSAMSEVSGHEHDRSAVPTIPLRLLSHDLVWRSVQTHLEAALSALTQDQAERRV
jgi:hypothetical protein